MPRDRSSGCALVANPHQRLFEGLRGLLQPSFAQVFMVADRPSLLEGARTLQPALIVVDLALAGGDLAALMSELHRQAPRARTLLLSDYDDPAIDALALSCGADGVVHKAALADELFIAVDTVLAGRRFIAPPAAH